MFRYFRIDFNVLFALSLFFIVFPVQADEVPIEIVGQPVEITSGKAGDIVDLDLARVPIEPHAYEGPADEQILSPDDLEILQPTLDLTTPEGSSARAAAASAPLSETETVTNDTPIPAGVKLPDVSSTGGLSYEFPIDVPTFRGLEPKLSLNYNSSRKTKVSGTYQGWLGHGWGLEGLAVIERMRPKMGIPSFDDGKIEAEQDIYVLNGQPLFKCTDSRVSGGASCLAGGNYVSEVENYLKISFNPTSRKWTITARDGTVTTLSSVGDIAPPSTAPALGSDAHDLAYKARWLVTSVEDVNGNAVGYNYSCRTLPVCYIASIAYNSRTIRFYYEDRPDYLLMGNGHTISEITQRIETILVMTGTANTSGYRLEYSQAAGSGASHLLSVQRFGDDLAMDAQQRIVSGTRLPVTTFEYNDGGSFGSKVEIPSITGAHFRKTSSEAGDLRYRNRISITDVNSDAVSEIFSHSYKSPSSGACAFYLYFSPLLDGVFSRLNASQIPCEASLTYSEQTVSNNSMTIPVENFTVGHFSSSTINTQMLFRKADTAVEWEAIFTKTENIFSLELNKCGEAGDEAISNLVVADQCGLKYPNVVPIDPDGNGREGLSAITRTFIGLSSLYDDGAQRRVFSDGSHGIAGYEWVNGTSVRRNFPGPTCEGVCVLADLNGDGLDDIVQINTFTPPSTHSDVGASTLTMLVYLFTGDRFVGWLDKPFLISSSSQDIKWLAEGYATDLDGDGKAEFIAGSVAAARTEGVRGENADLVNTVAQRVWKSYSLSKGAAGVTFAAQSLATSSWLRTGDFNGDGQTDVVYAPPVNATLGYDGVGGDNEQPRIAEYQNAINDAFAASYLIRYGGSTTRIANVLSKVVTQEGAEVVVDYKPSTAWANTYMPFSLPTVTAVKVNDGRGNWATTGYSYSKGYYLPPKRKFLGFGTVVKSLPRIAGEAAPVTVTTTYRQDLASVGLPAKIVTKDSAGATRVDTTEGYSTVTATMPYRAQNTSITTLRLEDGTDHTVRISRTFDAYGNIVTETNQGRVDVTGDEVATYRYYYRNLGAYLVSPLRAEYVYQGADNTAPAVKLERYSYDGLAYNETPSKGNLTAVTSAVVYGDGTPAKWVTTNYTYSPRGNLLSEAKPQGITTTWTYDAVHNLYPVSKEINDFLLMTAVYNGACEAPSGVAGINRVRTDYVYDALCRQVSATNVVTGSYVKTAYAAFGNPLEQNVVTTRSLPSNGYAWTKQYFDGRGQVRRVIERGDATSPASQIDTDFDDRGNVRQVSLPYAVGETAAYRTVTDYDWHDRPVKVTNPGGTFKAYAYYAPVVVNLSDNIILLRTMVTDEEGRQTSSWQSTWGDTIAVTQHTADSGNRALYYASFDPFHRLTEVRDHSGAVWTYAYDLQGNRLSAKDPDLGGWIYTHDDANRLVAQTDARGETTEITYNDRSQVLTRKIGAQILTSNTYGVNNIDGYYVRGQLTQSSNPSATITYRYNADGLLAYKSSKIGSAAAHVEETYYDEGRQPLYRMYSRGSAPTPELSIGTSTSPWTYNVKSQLRTIPGYITATTYELDGQTASITYANSVTTTFTYSLTRRWLDKVVTRDETGKALFSSAYTRDKTGRIIKRATSPGEDHDYAYDPFSRLIKATSSTPSQTRTYTYSLSGNMLSNSDVGTLTYPAGSAARAHSPTSVGGQAITYDANGNMTSDGERVFTWDDANRLQKVTVLNGAAADVDVNFTYGPDGARVKKSSTSGTTLYPGADVEYNPTTDVYTRYPHPDVKIIGTARYYLHRDHLNSVQSVTNGNGVVVEETRYQAYGQPTNTGMTTQKGYIGERHDPETGLLYLNARYMDPRLGRFISPDD